MTTTDRCPDCGAEVEGGRGGCRALWHELFYGAGARGGGLQQAGAFDAYCLQHVEQYCASAKSYAAHLTRMCCTMEYGDSPKIHAAIQRWLNGNRRLDKPEILPFLGALTVADVYQAERAPEWGRVARRWIEEVWAAYAPQHELARAWIEQALASGA